MSQASGGPIWKRFFIAIDLIAPLGCGQSFRPVNRLCRSWTPASLGFGSLSLLMARLVSTAEPLLEALQGGNHARGRRGQSEKAVLRKRCPRLPVELEPKLFLNCLGVLSHPGSESLVRQQTSIQANRKACGENLDSSPVPEGLYHGKLLKSVTSAELGPIQNFCAPYVGTIQNLEPMLSGVVSEDASWPAPGNHLPCRKLHKAPPGRRAHCGMHSSAAAVARHSSMW